MISGRIGEPLSDDVLRVVRDSPPYVMKLSYKQRMGSNSNGFYAIERAKERPPYGPLPSSSLANPAPFVHNLVLVVSDCDDEEGVGKILGLIRDRGIHATVIVYDKCNFCRHNFRTMKHVHWLPLLNVGREQHTWMHFLEYYYPVLPPNIILMSSSVHKHDRYGHLQKILEGYPTLPQLCNSEEKEKETRGDFQMTEYDSTPLQKSLTRPFSSWYTENIGPWKGSSKACWNGWASLSKEQVLRHLRSFYKKLKDRLALLGNTSEESHFMERSMGDIFF